MIVLWIMAGFAFAFSCIACLAVFWFDHEEVKRGDR